MRREDEIGLGEGVTRFLPCDARNMTGIVVEGAEIELEASMQDEAYRIAAEAVRNWDSFGRIHIDDPI